MAAAGSGTDAPPGVTEPLTPGTEAARAGTEPLRPAGHRRSSGRAGRRASGGRGRDFLCPLKCDDDLRRKHQEHVLSDSENEEPISRRIRHISAFIRKTSSALNSGVQRSRSCTDPDHDRGTLKVVLQPALTPASGSGLSLTAGVLLSSENSRCVSVPLLPPPRRLAWSAVVPQSGPQSGPNPGSTLGLQSGLPSGSTGPSLRSGPVLAQSGPVLACERSVSPDSNDSISEELNHFKPIVCCPCTPPKTLADGRVLETTIVKSTPRNLREVGHKSCQTWFQSSAVVLQKWRQIELDRQKVSTATNTANNSATSAKTRPRILSLGLGLRSTSKRKHKTKQTESKRSRRNANSANANFGANANGEDSVSAEQERADRALALRLQRHFDAENAKALRASDPYFLRSNPPRTRTNQRADGPWTNQRADGPWTNQSRGLRSSRRRHKPQ